MGVGKGLHWYCSLIASVGLNSASRHYWPVDINCSCKTGSEETSGLILKVVELTDTKAKKLFDSI